MTKLKPKMYRKSPVQAHVAWTTTTLFWLVWNSVVNYNNHRVACTATLKVGDQCVNDGPAIARCSGQHTYCIRYNNTCVCASGYMANSDGMDCSASAPVQAPIYIPIGSNCTANFNCGCKYALRCRIITNTCTFVSTTFSYNDFAVTILVNRS